MRNKGESKLEKKLREAIEGLGGKCLKIGAMFGGTGEDGLPDRLIILPSGKEIPQMFVNTGAHACFVETKFSEKNPRKLQLVQHKELRKLGIPVFVIRSDQELEFFLLNIVPYLPRLKY